MCGIAGILNHNGSPVPREEISAITDALAHRGPDGSGIHTSGPVGLGHRRLAILDLSEAGKQPMKDGSGRYWITYNGEVFNFLELRKELEALGEQFLSLSDTEVILAAYQRWGPDCVLKFNGMWAFVIWDSVNRELFLSRDRYGIKPLHYLPEPNRFVFASELKSFLCLQGFDAKENEDELRGTLATGTESAEDSLLKGVKVLPAGFNMVVSGSGTRKWRWWRTIDHLATVPRRFGDQVEQFRELFFDACRLRLRSDVPVATSLSGGLDSSSVLCSIAALHLAGAGGESRLMRDCHRAFVATFPGTWLDETEYARAAIEKADADPRYCKMDPECIIADLPQYAYDFETIGSALLAPSWQIYREMRRDGVLVSLDGHGGDELLAGYDVFIHHAIDSAGGITRRPWRTWNLARTYASMQPPLWPGRGTLLDSIEMVIQADPWLRPVGSAIRRAKRVLWPTPQAKAGSNRDALLRDRTANSQFARQQLDSDELAAIDALTPLNRALYRSFHNSLTSILRKYDRLSMAHGVETRMPFMDWRLVCFSFALPDRCKLSGGFTKRVLREAMRGVLPENVRVRMSKMGFRSPMYEWFNGPLGDWVCAQVQNKKFLESEIWNGPAIRDAAIASNAKKQWTEASAGRVWPFVQAYLWRQAFFG